MILTRKAVLADMAAVKECVEASLEATYGGLWTSEPLTAGDDDWMSARVACDHQRIIGVGLPQADVVSDLCAHPSAQGTALLADLESEIASRGFKLGRLRCFEPNVRYRNF